MRLLTVLELLQSHGTISGPELARRMEVDVRTVRRYIVMLQDMGIPVQSERGPRGAYHLRAGYKLPPLMFTDAEAVALSLGLLAVRQLRFVVDAAAVEGALAKTERVLPEALLQQVRAVQDTIAFKLDAAPPQPAFVMLLSQAVRHARQVALRYRSRRGDESERRFDPYGIVFVDGSWYTAGYCHLRQDVRTFRLDRVVELRAGEARFERPARFDALAHVQGFLALRHDAIQVAVVLHTSLEQARRELGSADATLVPRPDGVLLRRATQHLERFAYRLLSLPFDVSVLEPPELRGVLRDLAARLLRMAEPAAM